MGVAAWTIAELGTFYSDNRSELYSHAFRILRDRARSEEVVQEALLRVLLAAPELESEEHALGYIHRTIENICNDIFRLEGRRPNLVLIDDAAVELEAAWQISGDHSEVIAAADDAVIVRQALAMLSPAERAALIMWEVEGRSTKEISRELGIKEPTVRHTVSRARASLRRILSETIIDKNHGLTALDMLSSSYKKVSVAAKKSSKIALSIFLVLFAFLGFNSLPINNPLTLSPSGSADNSNGYTPGTNFSEEVSPVGEQELAMPSTQTAEKSRISNENSKSFKLKFPGLNKAGVPTGFTVADSSGSLGSAYFRERPSIALESEQSIGQIIKTESGAANIFISQTLSTDSAGLGYRPIVAFGQSGSWIPVLARVESRDITRMDSGNYLFTAFIAVESVVETPIKIEASAEGRDLAVAPRRVVTRMVLDSSKSQVLAQAVYVVEEGAKV